MIVSFGFSFLFLCFCSLVLSEDSLSGCDPITPERCLYPFPNDFWRRKASDGTMKLFLPSDSMPKHILGKSWNTTQWEELDGFNTAPSITAFFPGLSLQGLPSHSNIAASLEEDCPTVLLDSVTLKRVPHWAELDESRGSLNPLKALLIWPSKKLEHGRNYIVAYRGLFPENTGIPYEPSQAFKELRDNLPSNNTDVTLRRDHFKEIFGSLAKAGISQSDLQLAFDFTTGTRESITGRLIHMRDDGLARLPKGGPRFIVTNVTENPSSDIRRRIRGLMSVPLYTSSALPGSHLVIDQKTGLPVFQRFADAEFTVQIPQSLVKSGKTGPGFQYGHGLFGHQTEVESGYLRALTNKYGYVSGAVDWWGLTQYDVPTVTDMLLLDISNFRIIPDRCQQGLLNQMVFTRLLSSKEFALSRHMIVDDHPVLDTSRRFYNGNSLGGILGTVFMAVSQDIKQGVIGVGGGPFGLLLPRSVDFAPLFDGAKVDYPNPLDTINLFNILQLLWDRADPAGYMDGVTSNPLPNTPVKNVTLQYGLGDAQVSWLGCHMISRSMGAVMFEGNVQEDDEKLFGFDFVSSTNVTAGAVLQGFDFGVPIAPQTNIPPNKATDTHECTRKDPRSQEQLALFFETGVVKNFCGNEGCRPLNPNPCHGK